MCSKTLDKMNLCLRLAFRIAYSFYFAQRDNNSSADIPLNDVPRVVPSATSRRVAIGETSDSNIVKLGSIFMRVGYSLMFTPKISIVFPFSFDLI